MQYEHDHERDDDGNADDLARVERLLEVQEIYCKSIDKADVADQLDKASSLILPSNGHTYLHA